MLSPIADDDAILSSISSSSPPMLSSFRLRFLFFFFLLFFVLFFSCSWCAPSLWSVVVIWVSSSVSWDTSSRFLFFLCFFFFFFLLLSRFATTTSGSSTSVDESVSVIKPLLFGWKFSRWIFVVLVSYLGTFEGGSYFRKYVLHTKKVSLLHNNMIHSCARYECCSPLM